MEKSEGNIFNSLLDALPDAVFITHAKGSNIDAVNSKACTLTGFTKEELLKMNVDDLVVSEQEESLWYYLLKESGSDLCIRKLKRKNRSFIPVEASSTKLTDGRYLAIVRDITERLKTEEEILKSNERFHLLSKATKDAVYDWDIIQNTFWGNEMFFDLMGLDSPEETANFETWVDRIHPNDRERVKKTALHAIEKGREYWQEEYRFLLPNGSYGIFYDRAYILKNNVDQPTRKIGVMVDLTGIKKAEQALQLSEEKFARAFYNNVAGVAIWDESGRFIDVNHAFEKIVEFTKEELIGKNTAEVSIISEEDRIKIREELSKKDSIANREFHLRTKSNKIKVVLAYLNSIELNGHIQRLTTFIDITEKKKAEESLIQSEEQYRLLFNATPLPAWVVDNETHKYLEVNEAAIKHYGYSREAFLRMNAVDLQPNSELKRFKARIANLTQSFNGNQGIWKHQKKDGSIIDVEVVSHEILYKKKAARLVLANDITQKLKLEEEMKLINEELRSLSMHLQEIREEERINIAREIHDELGQQLTGLKMDVHWLNKKITTEEEHIRKKISDILELIDESIKTVRKIATNIRPSILDDLGLEAAMEWLSQEVEKRSEIKISFHSHLLPIEIPDSIKTALFRIYQEALTNVLRHAHAHRVSSTLQMERNCLTLEVKDDGRGFVPETNYKNTFGLLGIKERTNRLGGKYELWSEPGKGTTISISIPLQ